MKKMTKIYSICVVAVLVAVGFSAQPVAAAVRIKEIAHFEGARDNQLIGYGIIVGLNGTGDKGKSAFTVRAISGMLERLGLKVSSDEIAVKNAAAVMVTATLPPFVKNGTRIDISLSSLGDAKSLAGGILLQTPLQGPDGKVYAVGQGSVSVGGVDVDTQSGTYNTVARIPNGALVEREVPVHLMKDGYVRLLLAKNDFTTCSRVSEAVNLAFGNVVSYPEDGGAVKVKVPDVFKRDLVKFVSKIERIEVVPDYQSKIVINERTGTIVGGRDVKISAVSLTHLNINIQVESKQKPVVATPHTENGILSLSSYNDALFYEGERAVEDVVDEEISVGELAKYLNSLGVTPKDIVAILHSIKAAGAIQADIMVI